MKKLIITIIAYASFLLMGYGQSEPEITSTAISFPDETLNQTLPFVPFDNTSSSLIENVSVSDNLQGAVPMDIVYLESANRFYVYGKRRLLVIDGATNEITNSIEISTHSQYEPVKRNGENTSLHEIHLVHVNQNGIDYLYCVTESLDIIKINTVDETWETMINTPPNLPIDNFYMNTQLKYDVRTDKLYWMVNFDLDGSSVFIYNVNETSLTLDKRLDLTEPPQMIRDIEINSETDEFYIAVSNQLRAYNSIDLSFTILVNDAEQKGDLLYINENGLHKLFSFVHDYLDDESLVHEVDFNNNGYLTSFDSPMTRETACYYNPVTNKIYVGFDRLSGADHDIHILDPVTRTWGPSFNTNIYSPHYRNEPVSFNRFNNNVVLCKNNETVLINEQDYSFSLLETAQYNMYLKVAASDDKAMVISTWSGKIIVIGTSNSIVDKIDVGASLYFGCYNAKKSKAYFYHKDSQGKSKVYILNTLTNEISNVEMGNNISDMFVYAPDEYTNRVYVSTFDETHMIKAIDGETNEITDSQYWIFLNEDYCTSMFLAPNNKLYCMVGMDNLENNRASLEIRDASNSFNHLSSHYYPTINGALDGEFCYNPNIDKVYAIAYDINGTPAFGKLTEIDGTTNEPTNEYNIGNLPVNIVCNQLNNKVYIQHATTQQSITVYNPKVDLFTYVNIGASSWNIEYDKTRDLVFVLYIEHETPKLGIIDDETFVQGIYLPNSTYSIRFNPGNSDIYAYVAHNRNSTIPEENEIWQCRLVNYISPTNYSIETNVIPLGNWHTKKFDGYLFDNDILFDENQNRIYVANGGHSNISVLSYEPVDYLSIRFESEGTWLSIPRHERTTTAQLTPTEDVFDQENISFGFNTQKLEYNYINENDAAGHENIVYANYNIFNNPAWDYSDGTMNNINSTRGYELTSENTDFELLRLTGEQQDPTTSIELYCKKENWIGYFLEEEQDVFDALASIEPDIYHIRHQDYNCWRHDFPVPSVCGSTTKSTTDITPGTWVCDRRRPVIKYGDMIKVTPLEDIFGFQWISSGSIPSSEGRPPVEYYSYTELIDYETFVIELDSSEMNPTEIGAFVNDTCVGACSVTETDSVVVLSAYLEIAPGDSVVFEKHYGTAKMSNSIVDNYYVKNRNSELFEKRAVLTGEKQQAFIISFRKEKEKENDKTKDISINIFPNPAHNIVQFKLITEAGVQMNISLLDINGKKIAQLIHEENKSGTFIGKVLLNDQNGNKLTPGIYFIRFIIDETVETRKLVVQ